MDILGVRILSNPLATKRESNRVHRKRRNQSPAYPARIQKKWDKRFGFSCIPCAYRLDAGLLGLGAPGAHVVVMHPTLIARLPK